MSNVDPAARPADLCRPPALPDNFVPRSREYGELKALLRAAASTVAITTAFQGAGGYGKTTLAAALARDADLHEQFGDCYWITLGKEPRLEQELATLFTALTGKPASFRDINDAVGQLDAAIGERVCLFIIDDVWRPEHLLPFLKIGKNCARLFTTRSAALADDAEKVKVDRMTGDEAVGLLGSRLPPGKRDAGVLLPLARRLGHWPLLLKLASPQLRAYLRHQGSLQGAVDHLAGLLEEGGVHALDADNPKARDEAVSLSLGLSFEELSEADRASFLKLGIFPEDTPIPLRHAAAACGLGTARATKLLLDLADLSLAEFDTKAVRLHDEIRDYLSRLLADNKPAAPAALLAGCPDPFALPDAYAWRWYPWHLLRAHGPAALRELLFGFRWLQAKLGATDPNALIADYDHLPDDADARLVQSALRLSSHILSADKRHLPSQLVGRLMGEVPAAVGGLLEDTHHRAPVPWIRPLTPSLPQAGGALLRTLVGHDDVVTAVAVTPDGKRAVSGSDDKTLRVWDLDSGQELRKLEGHRYGIAAVSVTPDGKRAVSAGSWDNTLRVWDLESGQELRKLEGHGDSVYGVAVTPDGKRAVSGSTDNTLRVWDLESGQELRKLQGHASRLIAVAVVLDGKQVVSAGSWDKTLRVSDLESGQELRKLEGHDGEVTAIAVTPDGKRAVSGSCDKTLRLWDLESGQELRKLEGHGYSVTTVAVTPDGKRAVGGTWDYTLRVWDLQSGEELRKLEGHGAIVFAVAVTLDGKRAVSGSKDKTLRVWNLESGQELGKLKGHGSAVTAVAVTPDGKRAVSGSRDTLRVWDLESGQELRKRECRGYWVTAVALTPDGKRVISGSTDKTLRVWDLQSGQELRKLKGHGSGIAAVSVTPDGKRAVSAGSYAKTLRVWDLESGQELRKLEGHGDCVTAVAVTPDGKQAVSGSRHDNTLQVWDLESGRELRKLEGHGSEVTAVAVSPDGKRAVSGSWDNTLRVWDLESGQELRKLGGHGSGIAAVSMTPDGKRAWSGSGDRTLRLWSLEDGSLLAVFDADNAISCVALSSSGTVVAGDQGGTMHVLRLITEPAPKPQESIKPSSILPAASASVFMSYRQENDAQRQRVRDLALKLRAADIDVVLDQLKQDEHWNKGGPPEGWMHWSYAQVGANIKVLIVGTPSYCAVYEGKAEPGVGVGAAIEARRIFMKLAETKGINDRFRLVILSPGDEVGIPDHLKGYHCFRPNASPSELADLVQWIRG